MQAYVLDRKNSFPIFYIIIQIFYWVSFSCLRVLCDPEYLSNNIAFSGIHNGVAGVFNISRIKKGTFWNPTVTDKGGIFINYFDKLLLIDELSKAANEGTRLYINDEAAAPETIAQICMEDTAVYMPDYVVDRYGTLVEIRFDKVKDC